MPKYKWTATANSVEATRTADGATRTLAYGLAAKDAERLASELNEYNADTLKDAGPFYDDEWSPAE